MILVDTPIWSLALRRRPHDLNAGEERHVREWERLVRAGGAHLIGPIRQEILSGVRDEQARERLRTALRPFPDVPITTDDSERAAHFFNRCRAKGIVGDLREPDVIRVAPAPLFNTFHEVWRAARALSELLQQG